MKRFASRERCSRFNPLSSRKHFLAGAILWLWPLLGIGLGMALVPQAVASDGPEIAQAPVSTAAGLLMSVYPTAPLD